MPEITSRDRINRKLQEFESRMDGAISAADTIIRQQKTVEKIVTIVEEQFKKSYSIIDYLQKIQQEWEDLKKEAAETLANTELSSEVLHEQFDQFCLVIDKNFKNKVEELHEVNRSSREEHFQLVEKSRVHAKETSQTMETVNKLVHRAEELLANVKNDLHRELEERLKRNELLVGSTLEKIETQWNDKVGELERQITNEIELFKTESDNFIKSHQQGIEQNITEFLGKQNVLVQNLSQQIDGFFRQMQIFSEAQQADNKKIELLETRLDKISTDDVIIQTMHNDIHALAARLDTAVNRLQGLRFVGSSFRNL
ncbi:MAG: hypothetical protein RBR35_12420 [Salinivirgaceae bacterium]|nr:hypothetical protein [Salinivirgaceae bacterium]